MIILTDLPAPERWTDHRRDGHTCTKAPLCSAWAAPDWDETTPCEHGSCLEFVHEQCAGCFAEAMDDIDNPAPVFRCGQHGDQLIIESGRNSGFNGEGITWVTLGCGCGHMW